MNTNPRPSLTKDELRRSMRTALRSVALEMRGEWSAKIMQRLIEDSSWVPNPGGVVALFGGIPTEPDILPLLPWLADRQVRTAFFAIAGDTMAPRLVDGHAHLHAGSMGVLEPDVARCEVIGEENLDVVLLPGMAFGSRNGARLGRGKGHYDRVLERVPAHALRIGICFHLQLHDAVPLEVHDRHVQAIVTEREWLRIPD